MSKNLRILLRVHLLIAWRGFWDNVAGKSRWRMLLIPVLLAAALPILGMFGMIYGGLYLGLAPLGRGEQVLALAFTTGQLLCLMFGIFYVISAFYFSQDLKQLAALPFRPGEILLAKFLGVLVAEYVTIAPVVLPALAAYGLLAEVTWWLYIPFSLLIYLLLPVFPVAGASLFSLVLMRVANLRRNPDLWRVAGGLIGVVLAVGLQVVIRLGLRQADGAENPLQAFLMEQQGLVEAMGRYFPTSIWAAEALREGAPGYGIGPLSAFVAAVAVTLLLLTRVADQLYFGGLLGGESSPSGSRRITREELVRQTARVHSPLWALISREARLLNRTPTFLMAAVIPALLIPLFAMLPALLGDQELTEVLMKVRRVADQPIFAVGGIGLVLFMNGMSNLAATAISREGRHIWISRALPVAPRTQVLAKVIHSLFFTGLNMLVVLGGLGFMGLLTLANLCYIVAGGFIASAGFNYGAITIDLLRPSLRWSDPQKAMKGNTNGLWALLLVLIMGGLLGLCAGLLWVYARPALMPGLLSICAGITYLLYLLASTVADRRYLEYAE